VQKVNISYRDSIPQLNLTGLRADITNLKVCRMDDVAIRGCSRRCCREGRRKRWEKMGKEVDGMIERKDDLVTKISVCASIDVHVEKDEEAIMRRAKMESERC
jgi:hypothetical protein